MDLEIGSTEPAAPELTHELIGADRLVAAFRPTHPLAADALTPDTFAAAEHVIVSRRGRLQDPVDEELDRRACAGGSSPPCRPSTAALTLVSSRDLVVAVPDRICRPAVLALGLRTAPLPFALPRIPLRLAWHQRYQTDEAHRWMRDRVQAVLTEAYRRVADHSSVTDPPSRSTEP